MTTQRVVPRVSMIVAATLDWGIGRDGKLLYRISEDLKRFKKLTTDNVVIMGYNTYKTCVGRALPNRVNYVVDHTIVVDGDILCDDGVYFVKRVEDAMVHACETYPDKEIFVIGGAYIYKYCLENDLIDKVYLTCIFEDLSEDDGVLRILPNTKNLAWIPRPAMDSSKWKIVSLSARTHDPISKVEYEFREYKRK